MDARLPDPPLLALSFQVYRLLLRLYPAAFRAAYGAEMALVFRDCCRRALASGSFVAWLELWGRTLSDTLITALEEHSHIGGNMTRARFFQMAGWAYPLAVLFVWLGVYAGRYDAYSPYDATTSTYAGWQRWLFNQEFLFFGLAALLLSLGGLALFLRLGRQVGPLGQFFAAISSLAGLSTFAALLLNAYDVLFYSLLVISISLLAFGIVGLIRRLPGPWSLLCILIGLPSGYLLVAAWWEFDLLVPVFYTGLALTIIGAIGLGMAIVFFRPPSQPEPMPA